MLANVLEFNSKDCIKVEEKKSKLLSCVPVLDKIVSVRSHDYDVGEKLVPPYWRSEICHATPRVL